MSDSKDLKPTIGAEDINVMRNFFKHFKINVPESVATAWANFEKEPTMDNQEIIRAAVATAIVEDKSGLFDEKVFAPLKQESNKNAYYDHFKDHLNDLLTDSPEDPKS